MTAYIADDRDDDGDELRAEIKRLIAERERLRGALIKIKEYDTQKIRVHSTGEVLYKSGPCAYIAEAALATEGER